MDTQHGFTIPTTVEISYLAIYHLIITANEQACGYWVQQTGDVHIPPGADLSWLPAHDLSADGSPCYPWHVAAIVGGWVDYEEMGDDGPTHLRLTRATIARGLDLMAKAHPRHFSDLISDNHDAITADVFLQLALLGELRYG
jgi:hypothetical protein